MLSQAYAPIPRTPFALSMLAATLTAVAACAMVSLGAGAGVETSLLLSGVVAVLGLMAMVALIGPPLIAPEMWGLVVLGISAMRTFLALGAMLVLIEVAALDRRPVVLGILSGTGILLIVEAAVAVVLLNKRERDRAALRSLA